MEERTAIHAMMHANSFATLITTDLKGRPFASHLPFLWDTFQGEFGTLRAHMARGNPQWEHFQAGQEALVVFAGPHAYISPSWYENQPAVPTWNYAAVHAYGAPRLLDADGLKRLLYESVEFYEAVIRKGGSS